MAAAACAALGTAACAADSPVPSAPAVETTEPANCAFTLTLARTDFDDDGDRVMAQVRTSDQNCSWTWRHPSWIELPGVVRRGDADVSLLVLPSTEGRRVGEVGAGTARVDVVQETYDPFFAWARCTSPINVGVRYLGVCEARVRTGVKVTADLRPFGYSEASGLAYSGDSMYHFDLTLPATFQRGIVGVTFTGTKPDGSTGSRSAVLDVR